MLDNRIGLFTGNPDDKNIRHTGRLYKFMWTRPIQGCIQMVTAKRDSVGVRDRSSFHRSFIVKA
ncbi:MAG: hypothetical protein ACPG7F_05945 [Aggregatilineales bacterium]